MPIGVPLIICGSIALVGSGYAFKKLVYDQHLAHYIEAFIANHLPTTDARLAAPVSSRSSHEERSTGSTSAWSKGVNRLRRRKASQEDEEPLILLDERQSTDDLQESRPLPPRAPSPTTLPSLALYDQSEEEELSDMNSLVKVYDPSGPNAHDDEIKLSIFNIPSASSQPDHASGERQLQPPAQDAGPSGTFSFLSLSQVSSPEAPAAMLDSMTFSHLASGSEWAASTYDQPGSEGQERRSTDNEDVRDRGDDVLSMPDTGYSTEAFSNVSSPMSGDRSPLGEDSRQNGGSSSGGIGERGVEGSGGLGLAVEDLGMSFVPLRRQASVVSLSESEGGSDWERISVARST